MSIWFNNDIKTYYTIHCRSFNALYKCWRSHRDLTTRTYIIMHRFTFILCYYVNHSTFNHISILYKFITYSYNVHGNVLIETMQYAYNGMNVGGWTIHSKNNYYCFDHRVMKYVYSSRKSVIILCIYYISIVIIIYNTLYI